MDDHTCSGGNGRSGTLGRVTRTLHWPFSQAAVKFSYLYYRKTIQFTVHIVIGVLEHLTLLIYYSFYWYPVTLGTHTARERSCEI